MQNLDESYKGVFDRRLGFGRAPALLLVDFVRAYTTPGSALYAPPVIDAVHASIKLLTLARQKHRPVIFTRVEYDPSGVDGGLFVRKIPALRTLVPGEPLGDIVPELAVAPDEIVITKKYASAFFGTALSSMLTALGVDTILVVGCSTSGCIRATAVDGIQYGFRVIVPRECVADRHDAPHTANLFDIGSKYGDVVSLEETLAFLSAVEAPRT